MCSSTGQNSENITLVCPDPDGTSALGPAHICKVQGTEEGAEKLEESDDQDACY